MAQILSPDLPPRTDLFSVLFYPPPHQTRTAVTHISHPGRTGHHLAAQHGACSHPHPYTHPFCLQKALLSAGQRMTSLLRVTGARGREAGLVGGQGQSPAHASSYRIRVMGLANVLQ